MASPGTPTFDQLRLFLAVVETGSFAGAGRRLNRAVSVVSYGIANLEAQLGVLLFERTGTRRPTLTDAGRAVLAEARTVAQGVDGLRATVKGLLDGLEAEVDLAVDVMLPAARLGTVLRRFAETYPTVALRLHVETLGGITALVRDGAAGIGISGPLETGTDGIERIAAGAVAMVPVAGPDHPLARMAAIPPGAVRDHVQLVLSDRSRLTEGRDFAVAATRSWRLFDLGAKHALLREGIGWGNMPWPLVAEDVAAGRLRRLAVPDHPGGVYRLSAIWRRDRPPGPAAAWLRDALIAECAGEAGLEAGAADI
ncbi:MAG: LysR family transcriptional regulator [Sphingomonas fennica]